jgi:hypothetical protein
MKKLSSSIRESAIDIYSGDKKIEDETMRKFFYYIEAYCAETKSTEDDILFNDKKWNSVFELFNNIMLEPISFEN